MRAGALMPKKVDPFDTNEKKIAELRKQRDAKLAVVRYDFIDALFAEYDTLNATYQKVADELAQLRADYQNFKSTIVKGIGDQGSEY